MDHLDHLGEDNTILDVKGIRVRLWSGFIWFYTGVDWQDLSKTLIKISIASTNEIEQY